jgi:hypothetical protein
MNKLIINVNNQVASLSLIRDQSISDLQRLFPENLPTSLDLSALPAD